MKTQKDRKRARKAPPWKLFEKTNYRIFLAGVITIILGYISMLQGPHDSFWSLHLAPALLVLGYCILVPIAILWRPRRPMGD